MQWPEKDGGDSNNYGKFQLNKEQPFGKTSVYSSSLTLLHSFIPPNSKVE